MAKEMFNSEYYDNIYKKSIINNLEYSLDPNNSIYSQIWLRLLTLIENEKILDIGCGVGQGARKDLIEFEDKPYPTKDIKAIKCVILNKKLGNIGSIKYYTKIQVKYLLYKKFIDVLES